MMSSNVVSAIWLDVNNSGIKEDLKTANAILFDTWDLSTQTTAWNVIFPT